MVWKMWKCSVCNWETTDGCIRTGMEEVNGTSGGMICPKCSALLSYLETYTFTTEGHIQTMGTPYSNPIHSDALGLMPDQVAEHRRLFPYIEIDNENRPVFTNKADHEKYMDKCGIVNNPSHNRPKRKYYTGVGDN